MFEKFNKEFWIATFTLSGTIIGAGILGLPYAFSKAGFLAGLFWLIFLGIFIIVLKLYLGEVILRTKKIHQLPGYAKEYLGKWGMRIMVFEMVFGVYLALIAYLIGEGQSLSQLFTGGLNYSLYFAILFWFAMAFMMKEGLRGLKKVESFGVIFILFIIFGLFFYFFPSTEVTNLSYINFNSFLLPFGVVLFALLGFTSVPELKRELKGNEKMMKKVIIFGVSIPIILYIMFSFTFVSVLGESVPEVATLAFGKIVTLLGIFTMMTSYFVLSFALKDMLTFDFNFSKKSSFVIISIVPLILFFTIFYFNLLGFVSLIGLAGVISSGITGILIVFMNRKAKRKGDRKPEYSIPINMVVIIITIAIFAAGVASVFVPYLIGFLN